MGLSFRFSISMDVISRDASWISPLKFASECECPGRRLRAGEVRLRAEGGRVIVDDVRLPRRRFRKV